MSPGDHLWILGDLTVGNEPSERVALERLNELTPFFTLHLISGNHDSCHPSKTGAHNRLPAFNEVFASVQSSAKRKAGVNGKKLWLSHFPWHGDGDRDPDGPERCTESRIVDNGTDYLAHGHLHTPERWTKERSIQVGLDAWDLQPVSLDTIHAMILEREMSLTA
jgi:calcineurin-like phosphoesterase family protein